VPEPSRVTISESRRYPLTADHLYLIVSDLRGHHLRILPSHVSTSSLRVCGGPDLTSMYLELTAFEAQSERSYRLDVTEIEPGRAFRFTDSGKDRWIDFIVQVVGENESELTIVMSERADHRRRFFVSRYLKRLATARIAREVLDNIERYRHTLGSRVISSAELLVARETDDRD
jgi:hypothetical protein